MTEITEIIVETPFLDKYTENLTEKIKKKPANYTVYGRDKEVEEVIVSLLRSTKNSPVLVGEAGVGKTAILDGLVVKILRGEVPDQFKNITVRSLELSNITSENEDGDMIYKLKRIIEELKDTFGYNLLFIDEIHTIVGTGGKGSFLDAGNVIKPPLARGEIQLIGATTLDEFHLSFETDAALERRTQPIMVEEPNAEQATYILSQVKKRFEREKDVQVTEEAVKQSVLLAIRYIPERFLPDKAIDLVDEAVAKAYYEGRKEVTEKDIAQVIGRLKKIPVTTILKEDSERLSNLEDQLRERVKGQEFAIQMISNAIYISMEGLNKANKPIGSFLFLGTTGVGKTELAKSLAEVLFDDENAMIRIDCSEYNNGSHSVSKLIGDNIPGSKGTLTEQVKKKPYSVVLFDELEKASSEIFDVMLQILDDGHVSTGLGRKIDFKNTIIIATTNSGADEIRSTYELKGNFEELEEKDLASFMARVEEDLGMIFRPEFINRFENKVVFNMLTEEIIKLIVKSKIKKEEAAFESQQIRLSYEDKEEFFDYLWSKGTNVHNGARPLERLIKNNVVGPISKELFLRKRLGAPAEVRLSVLGEKPDGIFHKDDYRRLGFAIDIKR